MLMVNCEIMLTVNCEMCDAIFGVYWNLNFYADKTDLLKRKRGFKRIFNIECHCKVPKERSAL